MTKRWKIILTLIIKVIEVIINSDKSKNKNSHNESNEQGNLNTH